MYYLLFSDGTWDKVNTYMDIDKAIKKHWWPFPIDQEGDPRRMVRIITETSNNEMVRKNI